MAKRFRVRTDSPSRREGRMIIRACFWLTDDRFARLQPLFCHARQAARACLSLNLCL
jgi:hypothetical protein